MVCHGMAGVIGWYGVSWDGVGCDAAVAVLVPLMGTGWGKMNVIGWSEARADWVGMGRGGFGLVCGIGWGGVRFGGLG